MIPLIRDVDLPVTKLTSLSIGTEDRQSWAVIDYSVWIPNNSELLSADKPYACRNAEMYGSDGRDDV
jgi:hypothetical protein